MLTRASADGLREQNRRLVLAALRRRKTIAHTDICVETALSSATVTAITQALESEGVIERAEVKPASGRGRPRVLFRHNPNAAFVVIGKISSDAFQLSLVNYAGTLTDRIEERRPLPNAGVDAFLDILRTALARLAERSKLDRQRIAAISLSSKGLVKAEEPVMLWSPIFGDRQIDFAAAIDGFPNARIMLSNETLLVAGALHGRIGEWTGRPAGMIATLSIGHSIGLGIAQTLDSGALSLKAPNFGHMPHLPGGALCRCGVRGCIEAYAGFYAILRTAFDVPEATVPAKFVPLAEVDKIAAMARAGNRRAGFAFRQAGSAIGNGLARMMSLYEPMPVMLTGPGVAYFDLMEQGMREGLEQSFAARLAGMQPITAVADEENLLFAGNVQRTLAEIDQTVIAARPADGPAAPTDIPA